MAENNRVGQLDDPVPPIVPPPQNQAAQPRLRDIQRPVIVINPSDIQLSDATRNYELKSFHLNMLPTFNGLGSEDALGFMQELYSTSLVDIATGGYTGDKNSDELEAIYESLATNSRQKAVRGRRAAVHEISTQSELTTQVSELTKQMNLLMTRDSSNRGFCAFCNTYGHNSSVCMNADSSQPSYEEANYNHLMRKLITWDPTWVGNHQEMIHFLTHIIQVGEITLTSHGEIKVMQDQWDHPDSSNKYHQDFSISNTDLSSSHLHHNKKDQGKFPSTAEINPREGAMAVTLRSGKILNEIMKENEPTRVEKESDKEEDQVPKENSTDQNLNSSIINIPFAEALANMPSYAKYIKEIVSNKKKLEDFATVHLNEECSAILQSKLPPKLMDPGSFSIPCTIGNTVIDKCLCDLGASINLMPLTLFNKLEIAEMKPTTISLQLADRSVKYPLGVVEDILVKVGKFYFPADFLILDMGSDTDTSLILGRPFLLTG
ncbi:PREDICTED: uncharacterized protein LOC109147339 [Ipomoea nil]|uniref:uncharacterized protein LOC109147339 n=1 Tax=Ipomoea nil TaxID=35883 RepID=UPI000900F004|nr:PREDICTED: uncharacterized protein LOC109147339 [Ipomoea nil]